jgi:outer membrane protein OmpA-like peptidoglycan-associated protein
MATLTSPQEHRSTGSASATVLKLAPLLFAAVLAGCATKAQRIGSLSGDPSMAGTRGSSARASGPGPTEPRAAPGGTPVSQGGDSITTADAGGRSAGDSTESGDASSSSDAPGGAGSSGPDSAGGDQASALSGGAAGPGGRDGPGKSAAGGDEASGVAGGTAAVVAGRPGSPGSNRSKGTNAGTAGSSKPGTAGGDGASSLTARSAVGRGHAASGDSSDAGAADLSDSGAVAGLESDAAGEPGSPNGGNPVRRTGASASGTSDDRAGAGGAAAAGVEGDARIASIDVPSGNVKVDEEYRPQTLGGVLPLVLGVNEEGRFDFDQYSLRPEVRAILDQLAGKLQTAEYDRLDIIGYTDRIGTIDYNRRLSELRAYAVAQYLMSKGVPQNKIRYEGRGEKDPLTPAGDCQGLAREELITCLQKDRRVEIEASIHRKHATVVQ